MRHRSPQSSPSRTVRKRTRKQLSPYKHRSYGPKQIEELVALTFIFDDSDLLHRVSQDIECEAQIEPDQVMKPRQVLGAYIVMDINEFCYDEIEYMLMDRRSYRSFCNLSDEPLQMFRKEILQFYLGRITRATVELCTKS